MYRMFFFFLSFLFMCYGTTYFIIYLNFFTFGYSLIDIINFFIKRKEFYILIIGLLGIMTTIFIKKEEK